MSLLPHEISIKVLSGEAITASDLPKFTDITDQNDFPTPEQISEDKDYALYFLKLLSRQDFGLDADKWKLWFSKQNNESLNTLYQNSSDYEAELDSRA